MIYVKEAGLYFPDGDCHFTAKVKGRPVYDGYQKDRLKAAYRHVTDWSCAVDAGAHVGLITRRLAEKFSAVHAFEPNPFNFECLQANTRHLKNVVLHQKALGDRDAAAGIEAGPTGNSGNRQMTDGATGSKVRVIPLDLLDLGSLGLLKIDVQGYELFVLDGARDTIGRHAPVVLVECEPEGKLLRQFAKADAPAEFMKAMGAVEVERLGADIIFRFPPASAK